MSVGLAHLRSAAIGASDRQIARSLSLARSTVALTLEGTTAIWGQSPNDRRPTGTNADRAQRAAAAGLRWPLPATLTDRVLEAMLYAGHGRRQGERRKTEPDWAYVHHELRRPGAKLMLLWEEYRQRAPDGYRLPLVRAIPRLGGSAVADNAAGHSAGKRMLVDYPGQTVDVIDPGTGEVRPTQIFVAVMAPRTTPTPKRR